MTESSQPPGLATQGRQQSATVIHQEQLARDTWLMRVRAPRIAESILPGQFFMIRPASGTDPLLGRPFALFDVHDEGGSRVGLDFGYTVVGKLTGMLPTWQPGDALEIWGPLGNGFPQPRGPHLMCVAGGIGQTPFLAVAQEALRQRTYGTPRRDVGTDVKRVTLCYGARSAEYLAGVDAFQAANVEVRLATDDGTAGHAGFVTELLIQALERGGSDRPDVVYCCGPEPMMKVTAEICRSADVPCWLSLETPMACGFGACFSCVTRVKVDEDAWDYQRTCVEGPIFPAEVLML